MATITPKPYTVCDFCGKKIDREIYINQWAPKLEYNGVKYDLCCSCDRKVKKAIDDIKERVEAGNAD